MGVAMLSIVICSRHADISEELKRNVDSTIGLKDLSHISYRNGELYDKQSVLCDGNLVCVHADFYEIIVIDNSKGDYNIFSAYNEGVKRSKGDILCFMHEDILFHTQNWGEIVIEHFTKNKKCGLIGVEGTHFMARYASPWWAASMSSGQLVQGNTINGVYVSKEEYLHGRNDEHNSIEAVVVDGLWMCVRKDLFDKGLIRFDDENFSGFHCYDADICMQVLHCGFDVRIVYDILIEHKSFGNPDTYYISQLDKWFDKWKGSLPMHRGANMTDLDVEEREKVCENYTNLFRSNAVLVRRIDDILNSKAYSVGKILLRPFRLIRRVFFSDENR